MIDKINEVNRSGYALIGDISQDKLLELACSFGEVLPQYNNELMFEVSYEEKASQVYYSKSQEKIEPHMDGHDYTIPPKYMLIYCIKSSSGNDGYTEISHLNNIRNMMPESLLSLAKSKIFNFKSKPGNTSSSHHLLSEPVAIIDEENGIFRYSYNYLIKNCLNIDNSKELIELIRKEHYNNKKQIKIPENSVLILDNHKMLHSRTEYSDVSRKLLRVWVK